MILDPLTLVTLGLSLVETVLGSFKKANIPAQIIAAVQAAVDAIAVHKADLITKAALEAQRG